VDGRDEPGHDGENHMPLSLQTDHDLMQRRREIERDLKTIRPRAA
jgi:hypothetical protein